MEAGEGADVPLLQKGGEFECIFAAKSDSAYVIGCVLIVGVLVSYIPQHLAIIRLKSSQGIAWLSILLANVSTCSNTINAFLEQWDSVRCCAQLSGLECNANLLSIYQIAMGWLNSLLLFALVLIYFPAEENKKLDGQLGWFARMEAKLFGKIASKTLASFGWWLYVFLNVIAAPAVGFTLLYFYGSDSKVVKDYAFSLGMISTTAIVVQWTPQIIKTWNAKETGSLSILMLCLQAPGSFLVVFFQAYSYGENVSTWIPFLITGIQQTVLLVLCLYFDGKKYFQRRRQKQVGAAVFSINAESAPLMQDEE